MNRPDIEAWEKDFLVPNVRSYHPYLAKQIQQLIAYIEYLEEQYKRDANWIDDPEDEFLVRKDR